MADPKTDAKHAMEAHARSIDELHEKLKAVPGCDHQRLAAAVSRYKAANQAFEDDAKVCISF
jgi:hypothetical protein